jgi:hypothetical protein
MRATGLTVVAVAVAALALMGTDAAAASSSSSKLAVKVGTNRMYLRSQLHPGATVVCRYQGHMLSVTAPTDEQQSVGAVWARPGRSRGLFHLNVNAAPKRTYRVICGLGGYHW